MPERASVTQAVQIGVETTPGTAVAAAKLLNSTSIEPAEQLDFNRFKPLGSKFATMITPGKEWVEAGISGNADYNELEYLLASIFGHTAPVQQGGTTAYKWSYSPLARNDDPNTKTYTVEQGSSVRAHKFTYGQVVDFNLNISRDAVEIGGSMIGQQLSDGITMTGSPGGPTQQPILPTEIDVYLDPTFGAIGTTKLTRALSWSHSVSGKLGPVWPLNSTLPSFVGVVELEPTTQITLLVEADAAGMASLTNARAGSTQFMRCKATSATLAGTAIPYSLTIDAAVKVSDVGDFTDSDGVYAIEYTFETVFDSNANKTFSYDLINKQTAL